jgi:hypothetical protein
MLQVESLFPLPNRDVAIARQLFYTLNTTPTNLRLFVFKGTSGYLEALLLGSVPLSSAFKFFDSTFLISSLLLLHASCSSCKHPITSDLALSR